MSRNDGLLELEKRYSWKGEWLSVNGARVKGIIVIRVFVIR